MMKRLIPILMLFLIFVFSCSTTESIDTYIDFSNISEDISTIGSTPVVVEEYSDENSNNEIPPTNIDSNINKNINKEIENPIETNDSIEETLVATEENITAVQEEPLTIEKDIITEEQVPSDEESAEKTDESIDVITPITSEESSITPLDTTPLNSEATSTEEPSKDVIPISKQAEPSVSVISSHDFPTPVLNKEIGPNMLQLISVVIVITVLYTISIAIRGANKMQLPKGLSIAFSILFTLLSIVVSTLVSGWSYIWLAYLILLLTYFVFRARWRSSTFA